VKDHQENIRPIIEYARQVPSSRLALGGWFWMEFGCEDGEPYYRELNGIDGGDDPDE
jgi:hypothetical protein